MARPRQRVKESVADGSVHMKDSRHGSGCSIFVSREGRPPLEFSRLVLDGPKVASEPA